MNTHIPESIHKYFWGDDLTSLNWQDHQVYIIKTILEKGDEKSVAWLFSQVDKQNLFNLLPNLKLSKKSANFWQIYLS